MALSWADGLLFCGKSLEIFRALFSSSSPIPNILIERAKIYQDRNNGGHAFLPSLFSSIYLSPSQSLCLNETYGERAVKDMAAISQIYHDFWCSGLRDLERESWAAVQSQMIDAMMRLEQAVVSYLQHWLEED